MKIGLITDSVSHPPFEDALDLAQQLGLSSVEVATGNGSNAPHADLDALVSSTEARTEFIGKVSTRGLTLSALTANGNQLHPTSGKEQDQVVHDTIEVASELGIPTVVMMSGLPGAQGEMSSDRVELHRMLAKGKWEAYANAPDTGRVRYPDDRRTR
jgi:sugar phosphate isomerase/epimerase